MDRCAFCKKAAQVLQICAQCEKVSYCSDSHRKSHLSNHKSECFPASIQSDDGCGRYWVASKDISKGDLIFSEMAVIIGPNMESVSPLPLYPTCLGCCRGTNTSYTCSKCHWPVCNKKCEKVPQHADFECKIFRKSKIIASARPQYYLFIQFLRAVLLKNVNPDLFSKMMELEPHIEARNHNKDEAQLAKSFYRFISEDCHLNYDFDFVNSVVGVNRINSYSADIVNSGARKRACTALFWKMSLLNHDCVPNTRSVIHENPDLSLRMNLYASTNIWKGQCITQQYVPVVKGTMTRRNALKEWFFDCNCKRCADPTECGTFFSSRKCPQCFKGFVSPLNSLDYSSVWKCDTDFCEYTEGHEDIQSMTSFLNQEIQKNEDSIPSLESILSKLVTTYKLHMHHHLAIEVQYDIAHRVVKRLNYDKDIELIRRVVGYCRNIFKVVNITCPGYSYYRGVILYFMGNCLFTLYENDEINGNEVDKHEMREIINEGILILEVEPEGSIYSEMVEELRTFERILS